MFDQRLFNQSSGLDQGFGEEDDYVVYDKPLFADRTAANIYNAPKEVDDDEGPAQKQTRHAPVEFEVSKTADVLSTTAGLHNPSKRAKTDE